MSANWRIEACAACGEPMQNYTILVAEASRLLDNKIGIHDPTLAKVCSQACLAKWVKAFMKEDS